MGHAKRYKRLMSVLVTTIVGVSAPSVAQARDVPPQADITESTSDVLARLFAPVWGNQFLIGSVYVDVAQSRGWTPEQIEGRRPFVMAAATRETGGSFCFNVRGGDRVGQDCQVIRSGVRSGHYSDSGWFQVNGVHYRNNGWLCRQEGYCSADDIIATPQTSMAAGLALMERSGKQPWCFDKRSRRSDLCRMAFPQ